MSQEMQDLAVSIAQDALLKNQTETDVAAAIKVDFENQTSATRVERRFVGRIPSSCRVIWCPRAGGTVLSGGTSRAT